MLEIKDLHLLLILTYGLGANRYAYQSQNGTMEFDDSKDMESLLYQYENGQNYIEVSFIYAGGKTM